MHTEFKGDKAVAGQWYGYAKRALGFMKDFMKQQGLPIFSKTIPVIGASVVIFISSAFGVDTIRITAEGGGVTPYIFLVYGNIEVYTSAVAGQP